MIFLIGAAADSRISRVHRSLIVGLTYLTVGGGIEVQLSNVKTPMDAKYKLNLLKD